MVLALVIVAINVTCLAPVGIKGSYSCFILRLSYPGIHKAF